MSLSPIHNSCSEFFKLLVTNLRVKHARTNPVSDHPPGHCYHPHHNHHHHNDVVNKITTKLTAAASNIITTFLLVLDVIESYSEQKQGGDAHPAYDQEPGQLGFSSGGLKYSWNAKLLRPFGHLSYFPGIYYLITTTWRLLRVFSDDIVHWSNTNIFIGKQTKQKYILYISTSSSGSITN